MSGAVAYVTQVLSEDGESPMVPTRLFIAHVEGPGQREQDAPSAGTVDEMVAWARERADHVVVTAVVGSREGRYSAGAAALPWDPDLPRWPDPRWTAPRPDPELERQVLLGMRDGSNGEVPPPPAEPAPASAGAAVVIQYFDVSAEGNVSYEPVFQADMFGSETINGPERGSLEETLAWARAHASVVVLILESDGDLRAYSAGDEPADWTATPPPIAGLPPGPLPPWPGIS